jgi:hypothetical protein
VRFQVSQVMDTIEERLTTDVTRAQAVVDLGEVARWDDLDGGARPVNLVRVGLVIDALGRYLVDGGATLYGIVARELLSESALTSKERMVLGRWADDGLIEVTPAVGDRPVEVADLTGLPLIALHPYPELAARFPWLAEGSGRVLRLRPRSGMAALSPMESIPAGNGSNGSAGTAAGSGSAGTAAGSGSAGTAAGSGSGGTAEHAVGRAKVPPREPTAGGDGAAEPEPGPATLPAGLESFRERGVRMARIRIARRRFVRAEPAGGKTAPVSREWRCADADCPAFSGRRQIGQPVPRMRNGVATCPRHERPVVDVGPRHPGYPISIVVDDLPRRRLVVRPGQPLRFGRAEDDPDVITVAPWLHQAATAWISPVHLELEVRDGALVVTDLSTNGTVVWQRSGPDDRGSTMSLHRAPHRLGEWDSVELYTGIELAHGDRRPAAVLGRDEPVSVLLDAPTAALRQLTR